MMGDRRKWVIAENTRASETRSGLGFCPLSFSGCVTLSDFWGTLSFCFLTCKAGLIRAHCKVAFRIKLDNEAFQGKRPASKWRDSPSTNFPLRYSWKRTHQHMQRWCSPGNKKYWSKSLRPLRVSSNQRKEVSLLINKARPFCNSFLAQKLRAQGQSEAGELPALHGNYFRRCPHIPFLSIPLISASLSILIQDYNA